MKFLGAPLLAGLSLLASPALAADKVSFGTNWLPEAEHGGYYQALADGTYAKYGLDVTIVPGGPQANNELLLAAGRLDFYMGGNLLLAFDAVARDVPIVVVAAHFQKDPQIFMSHPGQGLDKWTDLPKRVPDDHRQGRAGDILSMDGAGLRFQGGQRQALHIQSRAIHRRPARDPAGLCDLGAVRGRTRRSLQAEHLPVRRQRLQDLCDDGRNPRGPGCEQAGSRAAFHRRFDHRLVQLSIRRQRQGERRDQGRQSRYDR